MQIRIPEERAEQVKRLSRVILREPFQKRSWAELGYFLASSALVCAGALVLGALGIAGLVLTVVFVGVLILAGGAPGRPRLRPLATGAGPHDPG